MRLNLADPARVIGMSKSPLLFPEAPYETTGGFRNDVNFPTAAVLEASGEGKIWYGAADTDIALATAQVEELIGLCRDAR